MNIQPESLELLLRLAAGTLPDEALGQYRYGNLLDIKNLAAQMSTGGGISYVDLRQSLHQKIARRLVRLHRKIVVGIMGASSTAWIGDELYHLLDDSGIFEPYVFTLRARTRPKEEADNQREYDANVQDIRRRGLRLVENFNTRERREYTWDELPVHPDICFWLSPWMWLWAGPLRVWNFPLTTLHTLIPYGYPGVTDRDRTFDKGYFDQELHNLAWLIFLESAASLPLARRYCFSGDANCRYTGYPKMDPFFVPQQVEEPSRWQLLAANGTPHAKKIIYSPHHSLRKEDLITLSTFADNGRWMLDLARKYQKETVWVFKPHPQLGIKAIRYGLFKDQSEWEAYLAAWEALPNATVQLTGGYHRLFQESDAIINDSASFMAEYLFVDKPMLELRRPEQAFDEFGQQVLELLYQADGKDFSGIERFVQDVVLGGHDPKQPAREAFFRENLDYYHAMGGHTAAENIFTTFCKQLYRDGGADEA